MRIYPFIISMMALSAYTQPLRSDFPSTTPPPFQVSFLYLTNNVASGGVCGVFRLDNKFGDDLDITKSTLEATSGSGWTFLTGVANRRYDHFSPSILYPKGQTFFQTWVPEKGGLYRLVLHSRSFGSSLRNPPGLQFGSHGIDTDIASQAFRVSPGPPVITDTNIYLISPTNFIFTISEADCIIVTNVCPQDIPPPCKDNYIHMVSGPEARRLITSLSKLTNYKFGGVVIGKSGLELHFYGGTNCLAVANFQDNWINCEDGQFRDDTGVLNEQYKPFDQFMSKAYAQFNESMIDKMMREEQARQTNSRIK